MCVYVYMLEGRVWGIVKLLPTKPVFNPAVAKMLWKSVYRERTFSGIYLKEIHPSCLCNKGDGGNSKENGGSCFIVVLLSPPLWTHKSKSTNWFSGINPPAIKADRK